MKTKTLAAAAILVAGWILAPSALAICRVVEPHTDSGQDPVVFDPTTMAMVVLAPDVVVDYDCPQPPPEMELPEDETPSELPLPIDPETLPEEDPFDPSICWDGSVGTPILDSITHVVVRPAIYADGGSAGLIMPVPRRADVHAAPGEVFDAVAGLQRAYVDETIHYTEDPSLGYQCSDPHYSSNAFDAVAGAPLMLMGCGDTDYYRPGLDRYEVDSEEIGDGVVMSESIETTDDYEVVMLNASTLDALLAWLDENEFAHDEIDDAAFASYVADGAWFMAVKVTPSELAGERVALAPLVVTWVGGDLPIMNALQYDPDGGMLVTDAFILAPEQMEVADGDGTLLYSDEAHVDPLGPLAGFGLEDGWLTRIEIVRRTQEVKVDSYLRVAEEPTVLRPTITRELDVRIAAACCESNSFPDRDGVMRTFTENRVYLQGEETPGEELFYTTPPPDDAYCPGGDAYDESSYGGPGGGPYYFCSASDARGKQRLASLMSWLPLIGAVGAIVWRSRRRRRRR
jgi:hypothetical protein